MIARAGALVRALLVATGAAVSVAPVGAAVAQERTDVPEDLPDGKGRDETFFACTACHGLALVKMQGLTRERWDETLTFMVERHKMPELDPAERDLVLDYLATHFPPRQRGRTNPFLNQR